MTMGAKHLKVGLRVRDLAASAALYLRLGFKEIPNSEQPDIRYFTYGHTWLILSDKAAHPYQYTDESQVEAVRTGPPGLGFVLAIPVPDLDAVYQLWRSEGLQMVAEPQATGWARVFFGRDLDGYELMFEQYH